MAKEANTVQKQIAEAQKQMDALLDRLVEFDSPTVIKACEKKIDTLETEQILLEENQANPARSTRDFNAALEHSLMFLSKPWKLWESGNISIRGTVLKLVFADHLSYCHETGARTPQLSMLLKALGDAAHA